MCRHNPTGYISPKMIVGKYTFTWSVSEHLLKYNGCQKSHCCNAETQLYVTTVPLIYHRKSYLQVKNNNISDFNWLLSVIYYQKFFGHPLEIKYSVASVFNHYLEKI